MDGRRTAGACTCHLQLRFLVVSLGFSRPWGRISKLGTHIARLIYRRGPSPGDLSRQWVGPHVHVPPRPPPSLRNGDKSSVVRPARPVLLRAHEKERAAPVVSPVARPPRKKKRLHSRTRVGAIRSRTEAFFCDVHCKKCVAIVANPHGSRSKSVTYETTNPSRFFFLRPLHNVREGIAGQPHVLHGCQQQQAGLLRNSAGETVLLELDKRERGHVAQPAPLTGSWTCRCGAPGTAPISYQEIICSLPITIK